MTYFDTDVLVHFVICQDEAKHIKAQKYILEAVKHNRFALSLLALQEWLFVLEKLSVKQEVILKNYTVFKKYTDLTIERETFERGYELASQIGFRHINDCLHTAIAEKYCLELVTYNKDDFKKIKKLSSLKITIL